MHVPIVVWIVIALAVIVGIWEVCAKKRQPVENELHDLKNSALKAAENEAIKAGQSVEKKASEIVGYAKKKL